MQVDVGGSGGAAAAAVIVSQSPLLSTEEVPSYVPINNAATLEYFECSVGDYDNFMRDGPWTRNPEGYMMSTRTGIRAHVFLLGKAPKGLVIDHRNQNRTDNRRSNLSFATRKFNAQNRKRKAGKTTTGVYQQPIGNWKAMITIDGKSIHLGTYATEKEAAIERDAYIFHRPDRSELGFPLNFPGMDHTNHVFRKKHKRNPNRPVEKKIKTPKTDVDETTVKLHVHNDHDVLLDSVVYDRVKHYKCTVTTSSSGYKSVHIKVDGKSWMLGRYLLQENDPDLRVDHINGNPLDNRMANLRVLSALLNSGNRNKRKGDMTSQIPNVFADSFGGFRSTITRYRKKVFNMKHPTSEEFVARKRDIFIMDHRDEFAQRIYYADWTDELIAYWRNKQN